MTVKFWGISFELSFPLVALMTAVIIYDTTLSVVICFISVIIHECGHLAVLKYYGAMPKKIKLTLFDIAIIDKKKNLRSTKKELTVVLAGVTVNFITAFTAWLLYYFFGGKVFETLLYSNLTLGIFNSLPVDNLDGGQALYLILSEKLSVRKSLIILNIVSFIVLLPTAVVGFLVLLNSRYNFTLLLTALYLMTLIICKNSRI